MAAACSQISGVTDVIHERRACSPSHAQREGGRRARSSQLLRPLLRTDTFLVVGSCWRNTLFITVNLVPTVVVMIPKLLLSTVVPDLADASTDADNARLRQQNAALRAENDALITQIAQAQAQAARGW